MLLNCKHHSLFSYLLNGSLAASEFLWVIKKAVVMFCVQRFALTEVIDSLGANNKECDCWVGSWGKLSFLRSCPPVFPNRHAILDFHHPRKSILISRCWYFGLQHSKRCAFGFHFSLLMSTGISCPYHPTSSQISCTPVVRAVIKSSDFFQRWSVCSNYWFLRRAFVYKGGLYKYFL